MAPSTGLTKAAAANGRASPRKGQLVVIAEHDDIDEAAIRAVLVPAVLARTVLEA